MGRRGLAAVAAVAALGWAPMGWASPPGSSEEVSQFVTSTAAVVALEDVSVIDGAGAPPRTHQTVVLSSGRITAVGPASEIVVPPGAERRRLPGRTVLPGLVMLHEHMIYFSGFRVWHSQAVSYPRLYLAAGVTTIRTAGTDAPLTDLNLKLAIDEGRIAGPRMFVTGPFFNGYEDHFLGDDIVRTEAEGRREVDYWAARGATSFKIYAALSPEAARGVIAAAHLRHLPVTGHLGRISCREAAELGIDNIEHSFDTCLAELGAVTTDDAAGSTPPDPAKARALIALLVRRGVVLTSTPSSADQPISPQERALLHPTALANYDAGRGHLPPGFARAQAYTRALEQQFLAQGGHMVVGADAQDFGLIAGYANHRALQLLAAAGIPPLTVIRMATLDGARFLGIDGDTGSVAVGKRADLLIVAGDPSQDMAAISAVEAVFKDGRAYDPAKLRASVTGMVGWR